MVILIYNTKTCALDGDVDAWAIVLYASSLKSNDACVWSSSWRPAIPEQGVTIICSKRGGCFSNSHYTWLHSVSSSPDAILFKFVPITSLLSGIPGSGYLSHAINLYLRCMPQNPSEVQIRLPNALLFVSSFHILVLPFHERFFICAARWLPQVTWNR